MDRREAAPTVGGRPPHPAQDAGVGTEGRGRCRSTLRALKRRREPGGPGQGVKQQMLTGRQILTENWKRGGLRCLGQRERSGSCQMRECWEQSVYSEEGEGTLRGWWRREAQHSHKPYPGPLPPAPGSSTGHVSLRAWHQLLEIHSSQEDWRGKPVALLLPEGETEGQGFKPQGS